MQVEGYLADNVPVNLSDADNRFGEIVEASVERLVAHCHQLYDAPALGTLVKTSGSSPIYGIVSGIDTASLDPTRRVLARGSDVESETQIYQENPQLERLLRTTVTITVVGYNEQMEFHRYLPPLPPRIHTFVYVCTAVEVENFTSNSDFLLVLVKQSLPISDEVLAACLRQAAPAHDKPNDFLIQASRFLASIIGSDTVRLNSILRRLPL